MAGSFFSQLSFRRSWSNVSWKLKPSEILRPSVDIERKFESHVGWQSHVIVFIIGGKDAPNETVGAQSYALDLITALNYVVLGEKAGHFQETYYIKHNNSPSVDVQVEGHLKDEAVLSADLFVQVTRRDSDSVRAVTQVQVDMKTEWDT